jgi:hypothetical protein
MTPLALVPTPDREQAGPPARLQALVDRDQAEATFAASHWAQMQKHYREVEEEMGWTLMPVKKKRGGSTHRVHKKPVRAVHDPTSPFPEMINAEAVAVALLCSPQHVYAMAAAGRLPHSRRDGRLQFPVDGIQQYLRDHEVA